VATGTELATGAVLRDAGRLYRSAFGPLLVVAAAFAVPAAACDRLVDAWRLDWLDASQVRGVVQLLIGVVGQIAVARLLVVASRGEPPRAGSALRFAVGRWSAAVVVSMITSLILAAGLVLLVVPGVLVALDFCFATPLLAATRLDANQVLRRSRSLAWGERWRLLPPLALAAAASSLAATGLDYARGRVVDVLVTPLAQAGVAFLAEAAIGLTDAVLLAVLVAAFSLRSLRADAQAGLKPEFV